MRMPEYQRALVRELRERSTESEDILWAQLRGRKCGGFKFRRQRPLGRFIVDFCCDEAKLVVEIDGAVHDASEQQAYDREREEALSWHGYEIIRFTSSA